MPDQNTLKTFSPSRNFFSPAEIVEIKQSWADAILDDPVSHGVNIFLRFFKLYPEIRGQMFGFLANMTEEELQASPRLRAHASGVIMGVTHIITGLENPVSGIKGTCIIIICLVVKGQTKYSREKLHSSFIFTSYKNPKRAKVFLA